MVHQNYQNLIKMTSNTIYIVAFSGGLKCWRKIHINTQLGPPMRETRYLLITRQDEEDEKISTKIVSIIVLRLQKTQFISKLQTKSSCKNLICYVTQSHKFKLKKKHFQIFIWTRHKNIFLNTMIAFWGPLLRVHNRPSPFSKSDHSVQKIIFVPGSYEYLEVLIF